jgi:hypothetical protein
MRLCVGVDFAQASEEAGLVAKFSGAVMVGMTAFPVGQDYGPGPQFADALGERHPSGHGIFEAGVGKMEILAVGDLEYFGRIRGFRHPNLRRTARTHVSGGQVDDTGPVPGFGHAQQSASAGLFDVVRVGGYRKEIQHFFSKLAGDKIASGTVYQ